MASELEKEKYRAKDLIKKREREILTRWDELLVLLERHRLALHAANQLMSVMRDLDSVALTIRDLEVSFFLVDHVLFSSLLSLLITCSDNKNLGARVYYMNYCSKKFWLQNVKEFFKLQRINNTIHRSKQLL